MGELLSENVYDILSRLPVKSLERFRCVSKQWRNYIGDPYLDKMFTKQGGEIKDPMLIMFHQFHPKPQFILISLLESKEAAAGALKLTKNPTTTMEFTSREWNSVPVEVLGSCKGLLYSAQGHTRDGTVLVVIHPLRKESYRLPPMNTSRYDSHGLGFDDSSNIFKMVWLPSSGNYDEDLCTMVHDLGTDSWRVIPQVPSHPICGEGIFAHEFLHWLTSTAYTQPKGGRSIIRFNMRKEEFGLFNLPEHIRSISVRDHLVDLDGQVGFLNNDMNRFTVDVWVLKRTGWVMHCSLDQNPHPRIHSIRDGYLKVLGFWNKDGDILITTNNRRGLLFVYNLKSGARHETNLTGSENGWATDIRLYQSSSFFAICYSIKNFLN